MSDFGKWASDPELLLDSVLERSAAKMGWRAGILAMLDKLEKEIESRKRISSAALKKYRNDNVIDNVEIEGWKREIRNYNEILALLQSEREALK